MLVEINLAAAISRTARVLQLEGMFDVAPAACSERTISVELPIEGFEWNLGLIVGPSGSGKTSVARQAFGRRLDTGFDWPTDRSLVDAFPPSMGIKDITGLLSSVGFSSPPSWLRPFHCLSNGEQFRATLARALAETPDLAVIDEFTSVVDRTVAQIGSAAVAKAVRRSGRRLIAVTCHYDVIDWLCPDWVLEMPHGEFTRRSLRRPNIDLEIRRVHRSAWELFKHHHYMSRDLHKGAKCFVALVDRRPAAFASVLMAPGRVSYWREHRTVCLPDFQGVGVGNALSEFVAGLMRATGRRYMSTTGSPAMIRHRARSPLWKMHRQPGLSSPGSRGIKGLGDTHATNRLAAGFEYVGPAREEEAKGFGIS